MSERNEAIEKALWDLARRNPEAYYRYVELMRERKAIESNQDYEGVKGGDYA